MYVNVGGYEEFTVFFCFSSKSFNEVDTFYSCVCSLFMCVLEEVEFNMPVGAKNVVASN